MTDKTSLKIEHQLSVNASFGGINLNKGLVFSELLLLAEVTGAFIQ